MSRLTALKERIEGTEALIEIDLDHRRNELVAFDLVRLRAYCSSDDKRHCSDAHAAVLRCIVLCRSLGSPGLYLASQQIDAERHSLFFFATVSSAGSALCWVLHSLTSQNMPAGCRLKLDPACSCCKSLCHADCNEPVGACQSHKQCGAGADHGDVVFHPCGSTGGTDGHEPLLCSGYHTTGMQRTVYKRQARHDQAA